MRRKGDRRWASAGKRKENFSVEIFVFAFVIVFVFVYTGQQKKFVEKLKNLSSYAPITLVAGRKDGGNQTKEI